MFPAAIYRQRRARLREQIGSGLILLPGNDESPMNFASNTYPFRQDSTFLYFFGLDLPGLAAIIDLDAGTESVFGNDPSVEEIVWTGPQTLLRDRCQQVGVASTAPADKLEQILHEALRQKRTIHLLPQDRSENVLKIWRWLGIAPGVLRKYVSEPLIRAVVQQRSVKSPEEIEQIEAALAVSCEIHTAAMKLARPGVVERKVVAAIEAIAISHNVRSAFQTIFSVHGETLHNPCYDNTLKAGDIVVHDSGAESLLHYAGDVTRTIPVGGKFSQRQKEIYSIVLAAQERCLAAARPGVEWRRIHRIAAVALMEGLKKLGVARGDPEQAVEAGAHTLFFPCGVGHMMGLDVHDMENLGEDYVGYTDTIQRNPAFGWRSLRLAKPVEPGFVVTVEPGIYFIPHLIDRWRAERTCEAFIDYDRLEAWRNFHGVRIEDDIVITEDGCRILGPQIPKSLEEVEALAGS
ncbi:MAG TPA: aminopeptidase P family protein [Sedimentisphaerales bacterium]|jgi:Xaa-Pro aminopeptidase|nr:aminopeptidase P family protein [Sedimentisphaerales bacterium]HNU27828.1 aminopeptidase P family protein [Sedimentisphaerales bacterium]